MTVDEAISLAIQEAQKGSSFVSPNPLVGCVIVSAENKILASGFHAKYGEAHAEIDAIKKLNPEQLKGATVYVTLEPCAHQGKTPSCARTLALRPIKKVIYGLQDPNPLVCGQGADILRQAGIEAVEYQGPLKNDLEDLCEIFIKNFTQKKIFVAMKVASSLDGQIALKSGESRWISGPESRIKVHELRSNYDALVVGRNTIEVDNPELNIRHATIEKKNKLIILDPQSILLKKIKEGQNFRFLQVHDFENIFFAVNEVQAQFKSQQIQFNQLYDLHEKLWSLNMKSVFIEGGAATYSSYIQQNQIDRLHLFLAPSIIGSVNGLSWTQNFKIQQLTQKMTLSRIKTQSFGQDIYLTAKFQT